MFAKLLLGLIVAGLAVRQVGYILMHGSIFESLREGIYARMDEGSSFFEKINELFTCKVCMTAQVSIWMVSVPLNLVFYVTRHPLRAAFGSHLSWLIEVPLTLLATFILAMAVAAVANGFWNVIEFMPKQQDAMRTRYEAELSRVRQEAITALDEQQHQCAQQLAEALSEAVMDQHGTRRAS